MRHAEARFIVSNLFVIRDVPCLSCRGHASAYADAANSRLPSMMSRRMHAMSPDYAVDAHLRHADAYAR